MFDFESTSKHSYNMLSIWDKKRCATNSNNTTHKKYANNTEYVTKFRKFIITLNLIKCARSINYCLQTADGRAPVSARAQKTNIWMHKTLKRFFPPYFDTHIHRQIEHGLLNFALSTNRLHIQNKWFSFFFLSHSKLNEPEKINIYECKNEEEEKNAKTDAFH